MVLSSWSKHVWNDFATKYSPSPEPEEFDWVDGDTAWQLNDIAVSCPF